MNKVSIIKDYFPYSTIIGTLKRVGFSFKVNVRDPSLLGDYITLCKSYANGSFGLLGLAVWFEKLILTCLCNRSEDIKYHLNAYYFIFVYSIALVCILSPGAHCYCLHLSSGR